jgi:uncharacterized membrane protein
MQTQPNPSRFTKIIHWLVPAAAILAIAAWFYIAPEGALGKLDAIGYAVCHRIDARSFHIGERQLPLCARCTGEFYSAGIAFIFMGFLSGKRSKLPSRGIMIALFLFFLAFGIDGSNSYLYLMKQTAKGALDQIPNLYIPNNILRIFTGSGMGIALAAILYPIVNQTLWRRLDDRPALEWKSFGALVAIIIISDVLSLLVIVFGILWIMIMRTDNAYDHPRQLWLPIVAGLTLALLLIVSIDLFRLKLTGTWGGFPGIGG